ncbi:hypothetical protein [Spirosoma foliorum]|uniref:Uncharacterized protein n=1 Tax=Spirosoma foliorum TaxID=2710596 RepID=A0A7G5GT21_9BACT|nr:hypothetical protein [Spirosoma foliorum]QMW02013.1 hypothetical protein H3H32_29415 [Spirosoma foliorum]
MALTEQALDYLEKQIPELAEQATRQAYWQTLASGDSAYVVDNGNIVEVKPDGTRTVVKVIPKPQTVQQQHYTIPSV